MSKQTNIRSFFPLDENTPGTTSKKDDGESKIKNAMDSDFNKIDYSEDATSTSNFDIHKEPAEYLKMRPKKSILKSKQTSLEDLQSQDQRNSSEESQKGARFDEMNILATHHPPDKDYGHIKIDEPKTPYNAYSDSEEDSMASIVRQRRVSLVGPVDANELNKGLSKASSSKLKSFEPGSGPEDEDIETILSPEELAHKKDFERKRRAHYNEGLMLKQMREKISRSNDDEE